MQKLSGLIKVGGVTAVIVVAFFSLLLDNVSIVSASGGPSAKSGTIAAKGLVLGANDKPIWVEFDAKGDIVREIGEARMGREFFPWLMVAVVFVLAMEHLMANRFYAETSRQVAAPAAELPWEPAR